MISIDCPSPMAWHWSQNVWADWCCNTHALIFTHWAGTIFVSRIGTSTRYYDRGSALPCSGDYSWQFTHLNIRDSDILKSRLFQYFSHFYEVFIQFHLADAYTLLIMSADVISDSQKQDDYQHL